MTKLTDQQIAERYAHLPEALRALIKSDDTDKTLYKIAKNNGLSEEDSIIFVNLAHMVLVDLVPMSEASQYFASVLDLDTPISQTLASRVKELLNRVIPVKIAVKTESVAKTGLLGRMINKTQ